MDQEGRRLALIALLRGSRRPLSQEEIREALSPINAYEGHGESTRRAFERDKKALKDIGVAVVFRNNGYILDDDARPRTVLFEPEEAWAVEVAARLVASGPGAPFGASALVARDVVLGGDNPPPRDLVAHHPTRDAPGIALHVERLAIAAWRRLPVRFGYDYERGGSSPVRVVEPWGLFSRRGRWYLVGRCRDRDATRCFRVANMVSAKVLGWPDGKPQFERPADFDLHAQATLAPWQWEVRPSVDVRIAADAEVRSLVARAIGGRVEGDEVVVAATNPEALIDFLWSWAPRARPVAPADIAELFAASVDAIATRHGVGA